MRIFLSLWLLVCGIAVAEPQTIKLHSGNARITFTIPHLLSSVDGNFDSFRGQIHYNKDNPKASSVNWSVAVRSVGTGNSSRDAHLVSPEYFDPEKYPNLTFVSESVKSAGPNHLEVTGKFTLKGVSKTITVPVTITEAGFDSEFSLQRSEYGFTSGSPAVGDKVQIHLSVYGANSWFPAKD